jgi:NAD(P)-dependent dehydrogenase (short-subunit alcohol dehydrogenase family)
MQIDLTDHVALVTGSAHRVGKAIALELARCGVNLLVHYRETPENVVRDTLHEIKSLGVDAFAVQADIGTAEGVDALFAAIREHFGRLHILVNSASNFQRRNLLEVTLDDWQITLNTNLTAPFLCTKAAALMMRENDPAGGAIVNILDKGAISPWPQYPHHGVSKAGLWALTQVSALSLAPDIRVNAVLPGPVMKPAGTNMTDADWEQLGQKTPLKRTGSPEDVGRAVVFLIRENFVTGTVIHVDGGEHLT